MKLYIEKNKVSLVIAVALICILSGVVYKFFMNNHTYLNNHDLSTPMKDIILKQVPTDEGFL